MFSPIPFLSPGDKIAIVAPARKISLAELEPFIEMTREAGFHVVYNPGLFEISNQFSGSDEHRAADFQYWLDHPDVKAIIAARGGYGTARIIDKLDFSIFRQKPKWLIGFSDFTVIHSHLNRNLQLPTLHAIMPVYMKQDSGEEVRKSFEDLFSLLRGRIPVYSLPDHPLSIPGDCRGRLTGGNLSVICSIMGSGSETDTADSILFLEDLDEYLYHMDRMMVTLKRAGKFETIRGVIVGHMNDMKDNPVPFGKSVEEIILEHFSEYGIPVYFGLNAGHMSLNQPLILGVQMEIANNCLTFGISPQ